MSQLQPLSADEQAILARLLERAGAPGDDKTGRTKKKEVQPRRRRKKGEIQYLTEEEQRMLFRAIGAEMRNEHSTADAIRDRALFEVAYKRGLRASEVGLIQMQHLRIDHKRLYVTRLKNGISGEFTITEEEIKRLRSYLRERGTGSGPLFLSRNNRAISRRRLDELMKYYGAAAGLPPQKRHFHCLRHSCATTLLDRDVPVELVQDHLGHTDIRNTMIYARVTNAKRKRKDEQLRNW